MIISEKVKQLTSDELAQASILYIKNKRAAKAKIPKPFIGAVRQDGTIKRFVYQETRHDSLGETQVYLDREKGKNLEYSYSKDPVTGHLICNKKWVSPPTVGKV